MTNEEIQRAAAAARDKDPGLRIGDFVYLRGQPSPVRIGYDFADLFCRRVQPATGDSFFLNEHGETVYSGGLDPSLPLREFVPTDEVLPGTFWHFDRGIPRAHSAVEYKAPCRVFRQI